LITKKRKGEKMGTVSKRVLLIASVGAAFFMSIGSNQHSEISSTRPFLNGGLNISLIPEAHACEQTSFYSEDGKYFCVADTCWDATHCWEALDQN
jgi:hypothetical protein